MFSVQEYNLIVVEVVAPTLRMEKGRMGKGVAREMGKYGKSEVIALRPDGRYREEGGGTGCFLRGVAASWYGGRSSLQLDSASADPIFIPVVSRSQIGGIPRRSTDVGNHMVLSRQLPATCFCAVLSVELVVAFYRAVVDTAICRLKMVHHVIRILQSVDRQHPMRRDSHSFPQSRASGGLSR